MNEYFKDYEELKNFVYQKKEGSILVTYRNLPYYEGMVLGIGIIFNTGKINTN